MYNIIFTESYEKLVVKWLKKHPDLRQKYEDTIQLMEIDPFNNSLRLHKLHGAMSDLYSVSIDMKYRIIIDFIIEDNDIVPLRIGDHSIYR